MGPFLDFIGNEAEHRSFHFFRTRTAPQLAGYFASDFWDYLVPLSSHYQPAIKHAVVALASLHERFENDDKSVFSSNHDIAQGGFALKQYNRAIGRLVMPMAAGEQHLLDTFLVACILFACIETLRGHYGSAISHIQSGVNIITSSPNQITSQGTKCPLVASAIPCVSLEKLRVIFARLDAQSNQLLGGSPMPLEDNLQSTQLGFSPQIPACFSCLEEAQNSLYYHQNRLFTAARKMDLTFLETNSTDPIAKDAYLESYCQGRDFFRNILEKWSFAFNAFITKSNTTMTSKSLQGAAVLQINRLVLSIFIEHHGQDRLQNSRCWDPLLLECSEILDLATTVVNMQNRESRSSSQRPTFSMDMNIVTPLFSVAHRCRDPHIRRRAISLLYDAPRQEGLWHSVIVARVAERIMRTEEAGLGEVRTSADVPEEKRISEVGLQLDMQGRKGHLRFSRRQRVTGQCIVATEPVLDVFQETIEW